VPLAVRLQPWHRGDPGGAEQPSLAGASPDGLWVACGVERVNRDAGGYADKLVVFEAEPVRTIDGHGATQYVRAAGIANLDFNTQSGMPMFNLGSAEVVTGGCVLGASQTQALALPGLAKGGGDLRADHVGASGGGEMHPCRLGSDSRSGDGVEELISIRLRQRIISPPAST
jgi:hypothetical protein